ncbi:DUF6396 domain-containing protein [Pseudomonas boanensis]|uniref:DUF6396 domain-containing protein n=1 Tax=Metapseudomonas boanensis TaxID=2822138 RepID=UPI0035D51F25
MDYLGQQEDLERAARYEQIGNMLTGYSYAQPKVPEINEIVPLPPAKLPPWDGTLKWEEEYEANIPPPKPSEALIEELAKAKLLDPKTGRPMPGSPAFITAVPTEICYSGEACPRSGYWQIAWMHTRTIVPREVIRRFEQGEVMPVQVVERFHSRRWPFPDKTTFTEEQVQWRLLGDA